MNPSTLNVRRVGYDLLLEVDGTQIILDYAQAEELADAVNEYLEHVDCDLAVARVDGEEESTDG